MLLSINFSSETICTLAFLGFACFVVLCMYLPLLIMSVKKEKKETCEHKWIVKEPMPIYQKDDPMSYRIGEPPIIGYSYLIVCEKCGKTKTETVTINQ